MMTVVSFEELCAREDEPDTDPERWGPWRLEPSVAVLFMTFDDRFDFYEVDLERCLSSAQVLDWICQVAGKSWATPYVVAGLVRALDDVLEPQASLCSWGRSRRLSDRRGLELVQEAAEQFPLLVARRPE